MKQMIKIIRKADLEKQYAEILKLELDYELASLYDAMQTKDTAQQEVSKKRLNDIQNELAGLQIKV